MFEIFVVNAEVQKDDKKVLETKQDATELRHLVVSPLLFIFIAV